MKEFKIEVIAKTVTLPDGRTFRAYKCKTKGGKWIDLKLNKECNPITTKSDSFEIVLEMTDDGRLPALNKDTRGKYPCFWLKKFIRTEEFEYTEGESVEEFE